MVITLKASHIVKPAEPTPQKLMYLSEWDQIKSLVLAPIVFFYRPTTNIYQGEAGKILKDSLSKALVKFYPLAGRLRWSSNGGGRVELLCNSMGVLLAEAESDLKIDDLWGFCPTSEVKSLIPSVDYSGATPIQEIPLLVAQITKFRCGGISLGTGMSHILVDGQSAGHFTAEWAKIARGEHSNDQPFLDRKILKIEKPLRPKNLKLPEFFRTPLLLGQSDNLAEREKETTTITLMLSKQQTEALKSKAKNSSRFEVVCAHIWKCVSIARRLKPEQETILFVTVDFRNRMKPPLPKRYFGNAIFLLPVSSTVDELLSNPLSYTATKIRTGIEMVTDEYVRSYFHCINNTSDISITRLPLFDRVGVGSSKGVFFGNPNLMITSWVGLPLYGTNFGWGDEAFTGPGSLGFDGKTLVIPSKNGDGSFFIPMRLQEEHVAAFNKNFYQQILLASY